MKLTQSIITALLAGSIIASTAQAAEEVQTEGAKVGKWTMDYDAATKLAGEKKLPLMLNFTGSDWCGWCKLMDKSVFAQEAWTKYAAKNAVLVTIDFPNDESIVPKKYVERNRELQAKFGVQGFPTYIVVDSDGETTLGQLGASREATPEMFIKQFQGVTRLSESAIESYTKANPDKADAYKAAIADSRKAKKALKDWVATGPEVNEENNKKFAAFKKSIEEAETALAKFH